MGKLKCIKSALSRIYIAITASLLWGCSRIQMEREHLASAHPSGAELLGLYSCQRCQFYNWKVCLSTNIWELTDELHKEINLLDFDLVCLNGIFNHLLKLFALFIENSPEYRALLVLDLA